MKKKFYAIGLAGLTVASMGVASAMPMFMRDNVELQDALGADDYEAFKAELELTNPEMAEHLSEHRFERFQQQDARMEAIEANNYEAFLETIPENARSTPTEEQFQEMVERHLAHEAVEAAIEDRDYDAWLNAVGKLPYTDKMAEIVSEEEFDLLVQMHDARQEGEFEEAREIAEELGLERGMGKGMHKGEGQREGFSRGMHKEMGRN